LQKFYDLSYQFLIIQLEIAYAIQLDYIGIIALPDLLYIHYIGRAVVELHYRSTAFATFFFLFSKSINKNAITTRIRYSAPELRGVTNRGQAQALTCPVALSHFCAIQYPKPL
jgi:hypothetical protein